MANQKSEYLFYQMSKTENPEAQSCVEISPAELLSQSDIIVFDLDGTLYLLDGDDNGFHNSTLSKNVYVNTKKLIVEKESLSEESAQNIINTALVNKEHLSIFLGKRYQLSREQLFNITWDIDPRGILTNFENSQKVIRKISELGKQLILLTAAPRIWQERVLNFLELEKCFSEIYYGEQFKHKNEIFSTLQVKYPQKKILSIGDQFESDIEPAISQGMLGFQVKHPDDLLLLFK